MWLSTQGFIINHLVAKDRMLHEHEKKMQEDLFKQMKAEQKKDNWDKAKYDALGGHFRYLLEREERRVMQSNLIMVLFIVLFFLGLIHVLGLSSHLEKLVWHAGEKGMQLFNQLGNK